MLSSLRSLAPSSVKLLYGFAAAVALGLMSGCIADTAEDTDLPWSSNKSWEGMAPVAPGIMDRYE